MGSPISNSSSGRGPGNSVTQRTVSLSDDEHDADRVLDFDTQGRLLGVKFLRQDHLPPGW